MFVEVPRKRDDRKSARTTSKSADTDGECTSKGITTITFRSHFFFTSLLLYTSLYKFRHIQMLTQRRDPNHVEIEIAREQRGTFRATRKTMVAGTLEYRTRNRNSPQVEYCLQETSQLSLFLHSQRTTSSPRSRRFLLRIIQSQFFSAISLKKTS